MSVRNVSTPRWMRRIAALCTLSFTGTFVLALPAQVLAQQANSTHVPSPKTIAFSLHPLSPHPKSIPPPKSLHENLRPLSADEARKLIAINKTRHAPVGLSLLDSIGHLKGSLSKGQVIQWQNQLRSDAHSKLSSLQAARLHLWLGEVRLAKDEEPLDANMHFQATIDLLAQARLRHSRKTFRTAQHPTDNPAAEAVVTVARRDIGFGLFYSGAMHRLRKL